MIYSCLENKTDAKYEVLIFEHFHSPRYRGDEREIEESEIYLTNGGGLFFSYNVKFPRIFSDAGAGGWGG